jgi:CO dehydrogenase maturation factor
VEILVKHGLKIAVGGKGGVGKTTVCAVWARLLSGDGLDVLAVDADPDSNLCAALGVAPDQRPEPLVHMKTLIAEREGTGKEAVGAYFRMNPEVGDLPARYWHGIHGLKVLVLGAAKAGGAGCACAEGAFLKALLSHTLLHRQEVVIVDLDAGVECMGRASIQGIDLLAVVVEPGSRSLETALSITRMARDLGIRRIAIVANKITDPSQTETIRAWLHPLPLLAAVPYDPAVQRADLKGQSVFEGGPELTRQLAEGKNRLMDLLSTEVSQNGACESQ